jgi:iron complex outermembrane recepter protein
VKPKHLHAPVCVNRNRGKAQTGAARRTTRIKAWRLRALLFLAAASHAVLSSEPPTISEPESSHDQLQEILVTAQKRIEDIKGVPISVSVISGAQVLEHHIADYDDISRTVPGVSFQAGAGPGLENIEIRGLSSTSGSATVGIYIDEVPVTVPNTFDGSVQPKLFDLNRIEVLRGPQGTLYGASSMGGTIRFITNQPDLNAFSASVSTDLSGTRHGGFNHDEYGILNLPVINGVFAVRLGVDISDQSGYVDHYIPTPTGSGPAGTVLSLGINDSTGVLGTHNVNDVRTQVVRLAGKYSGSNEWTVTPAVLWQRTDLADSSLQFPAIGVYNQDKRVAEPGTDVLTVPSLTVNKGFGWAEFTSVTSYFRRVFTRTLDGTFYNSNVFANYFVASPTDTSQQSLATATVLAFLPSPVYNRTSTEQATQEFRLSSPSTVIADIPTAWIVGLYFADQRQSHLNYQYIPGLTTDFLKIYGYSISSPTSRVGPTYFPGVSYANDLIYQGNYYPTERQFAPFADVQATLTPKLRVSLGVRYVAARSTDEVNSAGFYSFGLPATFKNSETFSATTPKVTVGYDVSDNSSAYFSVAKGFRLGGPTGPDPANIPGGVCDADYATLNITNPPTEFQSDSLWSYELGSKGRYADNHLSVNAAVYMIDWKNIQQTVGLPTCGFGFTTNVGDARILGSEMELRALVTSSLTLALNAGTTHAYITSVDSVASHIVSTGESILNVPQYTITPSADYETRMSANTVVFLRADVPFTGRSRAYFASSGLTNQFSPGYGIANLNVGFIHERLTVGFFAKNLLDRKTIIQYPSVLSVSEGYSVRPLTGGITAAMQF